MKLSLKTTNAQRTRTVRKTLAGLAACLLVAAPAVSDPRSSASTLPAAANSSGAGLFPTIPESKWIGLRLMILPQSKALQRFGYQELYQDPAKDNGKDVQYAPLPYADYVGRIVRVVGIGRGNLPGGDHVDEADLQLEGSKQIIHGDIDQGCMTDTAPVSDLETARTLYLGKTLWLASDHLSTYDPQKDTADVPTSPAWHQAFGKTPIKQYSPVKVLDIVPGWYASAPTRFIVQDESGTEGAQGYVDVHMSDTNVPESLKAADKFQDTFLTADPRLANPWPAKVWTAIENKQIFLGMTAPQVRMSWGAPKEVHAVAGQPGTEEWVYASAHTLTLKDGVLQEASQEASPEQPVLVP